jgi:hypothetical protein
LLNGFEAELLFWLQALDKPKIFMPESMSQSDFIANDDGNATWRPTNRDTPDTSPHV